MLNRPARNAARSLVLILVANSVLGAAMPMLIILGGLAGLHLSPTPGLATLPPSVQMLAGLVAAAPMSFFMGRFGRRVGFMLGALLALIGGLAGVLALISASFIFLCFAHALLGAALVCFNYFRFAAGEVVPAEWQSVAISLTLGSGLIAALAGPEIFVHTKDLLSTTPLAGAYLAISALSLTGVVPLIFLPDTRVPQSASEQLSEDSAMVKKSRRRMMHLAILSAVVAQGVMVLMMTPTPMAMIGQGFLASDASDVIRWHVMAMFAPSFITGFLVRRFSAPPIIAIGMLLLALAASTATQEESLSQFYLSLVLLGLGWNFGLIGATSLLSTVVPAAQKPRVQGINDTLMALSSTVMAFASGIITAEAGWAWVGLSAFPFVTLALAALLLNGLASSRSPRTA